MTDDQFATFLLVQMMEAAPAGHEWSTDDFREVFGHLPVERVRAALAANVSRGSIYAEKTGFLGRKIKFGLTMMGQMEAQAFAPVLKAVADAPTPEDAKRAVAEQLSDLLGD